MRRGSVGFRRPRSPSLTLSTRPKPRDAFLDNAKFLAIVLVVIGHAIDGLVPMVLVPDRREHLALLRHWWARVAGAVILAGVGVLALLFADQASRPHSRANLEAERWLDSLRGASAPGGLRRHRVTISLPEIVAKRMYFGATEPQTASHLRHAQTRPRAMLRRRRRAGTLGEMDDARK